MGTCNCAEISKSNEQTTANTMTRDGGERDREICIIEDDSSKGGSSALILRSKERILYENDMDKKNQRTTTFGAYNDSPPNLKVYGI